MFLPIGDEPNPRGFVPWVTWALIAVNVLVHLAWGLPLSATPADPSDPRVLAAGAAARGLTAWDLFLLDHGFVPAAPSLADLLTSMFLHAGLAHLAGNLLILWIYGDNVEHRLGRWGYLATYLLTGATATVGFAALTSDPTIPMVGASGAISGVLGCYLVSFPRNRVRVFVALFPFVVGVRLVPAPIVLGLYVLLDNVLPALVGDGTDGVAYGAHLGGFAAGVAIAVVAARTGWGRRSAEGDERSLREAVGADDRARAHLRLGESLVDFDPAGAYQHLLAALDGARDPEVASRARAALARLPLHPLTRRRLGL